MKTPSKLWLYAALIIGAAIGGHELASAAGGAGNVVTSVSSTDLIPLDSGTLASDVQLSTLATFFNSGGGGNATFGSGVNQITLTGAATGSPPIVGSGGTSSDTNAPLSIDPKGTGTLFLSGTTTTNAAEQILSVASQVNNFVLTPAATGNTPGFEAGGAGADAGLGVAFGTIGTGAIAFDTSTNVQQFAITHTATAVDYLNATGAAAGTPGTPTLSALGTDTNINMVLLSKAAGNVKLGTSTSSACSGTTTATCQGQRFVASITGLTTAAAGTTSAAMTVTDANVVSSAASVICSVNGYAGTGIPIVSTIIPGTGSVSFTITNVAASGSLNATVPVACLVLGT